MAASLDNYLVHGHGVGARPAASTARRLADRVFRVVRDYRARRALYGLSDAMLKDIGLRRGDLGQLEPEGWLQPTDWRALDALRHGQSR